MTEIEKIQNIEVTQTTIPENKPPVIERRRRRRRYSAGW